ncbi:unnamed protein product [Adineta steineri]|uniref:Uncharacterized protein n=1 Tax=Adineta steineri TaxID=433720 RepID=A0A814PMW2_9BILA|nr:unnamed protein product [Adineta steineri]
MNSFTNILLCLYVATVSTVVLPELHVIKQASFKYPYSCQPQPIKYENCALFLTQYGVSHNAPDLLYNGACGSDNVFDVMLAGSNFGMLSDLGDVPLETVSASKAFNYNRKVGKDNAFVDSIPVVKGHTYAAVLAKSDIRALFVFRVDSYERSGPAVISYAVKQYAMMNVVQEAPGFDWDAPNH